MNRIPHSPIASAAASTSVQERSAEHSSNGLVGQSITVTQHAPHTNGAGTNEAKQLNGERPHVPNGVNLTPSEVHRLDRQFLDQPTEAILAWAWQRFGTKASIGTSFQGAGLV